MKQTIDVPEEILDAVIDLERQCHARSTAVNSQYMDTRLREEREAAQWGRSKAVQLPPREPSLATYVNRRGVLMHLVRLGLAHFEVNEAIADMAVQGSKYTARGAVTLEQAHALLTRFPEATKKAK